MRVSKLQGVEVGVGGEDGGGEGEGDTGIRGVIGVGTSAGRKEESELAALIMTEVLQK